MFKTISDVLYETWNFRLSTMIFGEREETTDSKYKNKEFCKVSTPKNPHELPSIYFNTYRKSLIGFMAISKDIGVKDDGIWFSVRSYHEILDAMNVCVEWLKSSKFKYLYDVSSDGIVKGLGNPAPYNPIVHKNQFEFIRFSPAVVTDFNGIKYEGVVIKTQRGAIAQLTCSEFLALHAAVKSFTTNYNAISNTLVTNALLITMMKKLK